jgi:hypothetical protein
MRAAVAAALVALALLAAAQDASARGHVCPSGTPSDPATEHYDARELVGLRVGEARRIAESHRCLLRVVRRDGEPLVVTQDFRTDRINVSVRDHIVRRIVGIY